LDDPVLILQCSPEDFESKKQEACTKLAKFIVDIYDTSLRNQVITEIIRRLQFRCLLTMLEHYELLQVYCNLRQDREKGTTVKSQAMKLVVMHSKPGYGQAPKIHTKTISKLVKGAIRIRRLLELSGNNFNIIDAFPDLQINFFTGTGLNATNFERWLLLVKNNRTISIKEGKSLYHEYKASAKKTRLENLKKQF
jgi:hypothetical protein